MCNFNAICYNCKRCCRCARNSHRGRNLYKCNAQQLNHLAYRPNHTMIKPVSLPISASSCPPSTDYGHSTSRSSEALSQNGTTLTGITSANGSVSPSRIVSTVTEAPLVECQTSFTKGSTLTTNSKKHPLTQRSEAMGSILATNQKPLNYNAEQADTNSLVDRLISQVFPSCPQRCSVSACTCFCPQVTAPQQDTRNKSAMNISRAEIKPNERRQRSFSYLRSAKLKQEPSKAEPVLEMVKAKSKAKKKVKRKVAVNPAIPEAEEGKDFWFECNVPMRVSIPTSICLGAPWDNLASLPQTLPTDNNKLMALPAPGNNNSKALVNSDRNLLPPKASATLPQIPRNLCISVLPMGYRPSVPPPCKQIEEPPPVEPKLAKKKKKKLHPKKKSKTNDTPQKASLCSCCFISHQDQLEDFCKWINRETGEYATRKESQKCSLHNGMEKYERCQCRRTKNREQALESRNEDKAKRQEKRSHGGLSQNREQDKRSHGGLNQNREQSKELRNTIDEEGSKICYDSTSKNREQCQELRKSIDGKPNADYNSRSGFYSLSEDMTSLKRCPCMIIQSQEQSIDTENQDARTGCHNYALSKDMLSTQRSPSNLDKSILSHKLKKRNSSNESLIKPNQALNVDQRKYSVEAKTLPESMDSRRNATAESRMPHLSSQRSFSCDSNNARLKFDSVTPNRSNSVGNESTEKKNYNESLTKDPSIVSDEAESNVNRNAGGRNKTEVDWNNLIKFMKMFSPQSTAAPKCLVDKSTYVRTIDKCKIKCKHQNYNMCTEPKNCQRNSVESGRLGELMAALPHHSNSRLIELLKREKRKIRKQSRSSDAKKDGKPQVPIENKSECRQSLSSKYPHKASHKSSLSIAKDFKLCILRQDCNDSPPVLEEYKVAACSAYSSQENARNREGKCRNMKNADSFWCNLKRFCRKNCITCRDMLQKPVVLVPFRPGSDHNGKLMGMCKPDEWKELKIPRKSSSKHRNNQCPDDCAKSLPSLSENPSGRAYNGGQAKVKIGRKYSKGPCIATSSLQHRSNQSRCCNCQVESMLYEYLRNNCQSSRSQSAKSKSFPTDTKQSSQASPKQRHSTPSEASPRPFPPETEARESELNEAKRRQSHNRIQSQQSESLPSFRKTVDPSRSASPKYPVFQAQSFVKDHSQVASEAKDAPNRSESPSTSGFRADIRPLCSRIQLERSNQRHQTEVACDDIVLHLKPRPMRCTSKDLRHQDEVSENDISQIARGASSRQKQMRDLDEIVQSQDSVQCCNCSLNMSSEFENQKELQLQKVMQEANYAYDRRHGQQFIECARSQHGETRREEAERICCCGYSQQQQQQQQRQQRQQQIEQQQQQQRLHQQQLQHQQQQQQQQRQQQQQMQHQQQQRQQQEEQQLNEQQQYRQQQQIRQEDECTSYCRCPLSYQQQQMIPEQQQHVQLNNIQQHQYMQQQHKQFEEDANYWPNTQQQRSQMLHHHDNNMQNDELFNCPNCLIAPSQQQLQCLPGFYSHIAPAPDLRSVRSSFYQQTLLKYGIQRLPDDYLQQLPPEAVCCASASCSCCTCCPYAYGQQQQQQPHLQ